jgi:hypothetical protein
MLLFSVAGENMLWVTVWTKLPHRNMYSIKGDTYFALIDDVINTCTYRIQDELAYVVPPRDTVVASLRKE